LPRGKSKSLKYIIVDFPEAIKASSIAVKRITLAQPYLGWRDGLLSTGRAFAKGVESAGSPPQDYLSAPETIGGQVAEELLVVLA
jgi:hypothetical protein